MFFVVGFLTFVVTLGLYVYLKFARTLKLAKAYESPPTIPLLGHGHNLIGKHPEEHGHVIYQWFKHHGKTISIWIGPIFNILSHDVKFVEAVMGTTTFNDKADQYRFLSSWLNEGLLISRGKKWFKRRKIITPAFHFKILEQYIDLFNKHSQILVSKIKQHENKEPFDLYSYVTLYTLDTICETAMGVSMNAQTDSSSEYVQAVKTISTVIHKRMFDIMYVFNFIFQFTKLAREEKSALNILHGFTEKLIVQRREEILRSKDKTFQTPLIDETGVKRKQNFLDILLQSEIDGKPLTNLDIREEVDTFMFEGHDTTSSAIGFCLYNLCLYPEAQAKCVKEIYDVLGTDKSKPLSYEDLNNLHYIELCIKETLRMYPSVPILGRKVLNECEINGKLVPSGTNLIFSPMLLGRAEEYFPNANEFIPERFDAETSAHKLNPYAYIPFSAGPRNCIGQKFAILETKTILVNVLRNFEVEFYGTKSGEINLLAELILKIRDPPLFKIKPRF